MSIYDYIKRNKGGIHTHIFFIHEKISQAGHMADIQNKQDGPVSGALSVFPPLNLRLTFLSQNI